MTFYFAAESVRELAEYPAPVRRLIVRRAISLLSEESRLATRLPDLMSVCGVLLGVTGALVLTACVLHPRPLAEQIQTGMLCDLAGAFIGGLGGGFIGLQVQIQK